MKRCSFAITFASLALAACTSSRPEQPAGEPLVAPTPEELAVPYSEQDERTRNARARMVGYFPNPTLVTHENEEVRFYDDLVVGKCVVINFMYTVCDGI